ncbi:hypothetical protein [Agromyces agglutinans]|uniref:hypothetical protein n=1 Tax=Agromyces agglutinans TaxID=2662258 RepID=UPI001561D333|nr:hypothetical protein [Agromyces agglutinans]
MGTLDAAVDAATASSGAGSGLATAVLPLLALAGSLVAAVVVASLLVVWLQRPADGVRFAPTDPMVAGLLPVAFVSGSASARWLPAAVMRLAAAGVLAIRDERATDVTDERAARDVRLLLLVDPARARPSVAALETDESQRVEDGIARAVVAPGRTGDSFRFAPNTSVALDQVVGRNIELLEVTRAAFARAAAQYREPRPAARFRAITVGGVVGVALGLLSLGLQDEASMSISWSAIGIGAVALAFRPLLPRWIPLNADGLLLRARTHDLRELVVGMPVHDEQAAALVLPWAMLFDDQAVVRGFAAAAEACGRPPSWYRTTGEFSAERLVSCLALVGSALAQPIGVGGGLLARREDSRFGVPLIDDHKGWGGGYLAGGSGADGGGMGGFGGDGGGGGGGYDGGGGGGGFGGFDGGGGGGDGGGGG